MLFIEHYLIQMKRIDAQKIKFLSAFKASRGIVSIACESLKINRTTFYRWYNTDENFKLKIEEIKEEQIDFVENKLLKNIEKGDTTSIIFYLKTKGKARGYSEKAMPATKETPPAVAATEAKTIESKIKHKRTYITKILKEQGKYTAELTYQVDIAARLLVKADILASQMVEPTYKAVNIEYSREGNERAIINPQERLYMDILRQAQNSLRALGMNTESKERTTDNDTFSDFMKEF